MGGFFNRSYTYHASILPSFHIPMSVGKFITGAPMHSPLVADRLTWNGSMYAAPMLLFGAGACCASPPLPQIPWVCHAHHIRPGSVSKRERRRSFLCQTYPSRPRDYHTLRCVRRSRRRTPEPSRDSSAFFRVYIQKPIEQGAVAGEENNPDQNNPQSRKGKERKGKERIGGDEWLKRAQYSLRLTRNPTAVLAAVAIRLRSAGTVWWAVCPLRGRSARHPIAVVHVCYFLLAF